MLPIMLYSRDRLESASGGSEVRSPPMLDHDRSGTRLAVERHSDTDTGRAEIMVRKIRQRIRQRIGREVNKS